MLMHGSSGSMATGGFGTSLGVVKSAVRDGKGTYSDVAYRNFL